MEEIDLAIIGGGSAGYVAAIRAADLGLSVLLVENRELGGTCLNRGCIPTKALLKSAEIYREAQESKIFGINVPEVSYHLSAINEWKENCIRRLVQGVDFLLKSRRVVVERGTGRLVDTNTVEVTRGEDKAYFKARDIIIATGSEPAMIPAFKIDRVNVLTSDEALNVDSIPEDILIVGAGAIGIEFANFFSAFGSKVTIVEMMPQVVPTLKDKRIATLVQRILNKKGVDVKLGAKIENIEIKDNGIVHSTLDTGETLQNHKVLVSIGRKLNSDGLGLEDAGVKIDRGRIIVDEYLRTNVPHIYAVGDVTGGLLLAHKAQKEGEVVAEVIAGKDVKMDYRVVPWAIFSTPEIASVGLTEEEAAEEGIAFSVGEFPFVANGKAVTMNETDGIVKVVARKDNSQILGAQIVGPDASVIISELALAVQMRVTLQDIAKTIHTHPTLPEAAMEAAKAALGEAIHIAKR